MEKERNTTDLTPHGWIHQIVTERHVVVKPIFIYQDLADMELLPEACTFSLLDFKFTRLGCFKLFLNNPIKPLSATMYTYNMLLNVVFVSYKRLVAGDLTCCWSLPCQQTKSRIPNDRAIRGK